MKQVANKRVLHIAGDIVLIGLLLLAFRFLGDRSWTGAAVLSAVMILLFEIVNGVALRNWRKDNNHFDD